VRKRGTTARKWLIPALLLVIGGVALYLGWQAWASFRFHAAEQALARRDFAEARRLLNAHVQGRSPSGETLLLAAQAARRDGALDETPQILDAALRANAVPEAVAFERELLRLQSGQTDDAERFLEVCTAHPTAEQSPLILEALIVGSLKRLDLVLAKRCLDLWQKTRDNQPDRIQGWIWRGEVALRQGDRDTAEREYRQAVAADPRNEQARLRLAELLSRFAPREALDQLDALPQQRWDDRDVRFQRARSYRALGEYETADELLTKIIAESPDDYGAILERGHLAMELRQFEPAERWYRAALKIQPELREPNEALARCLQLLGKTDESQRYRDKVARIDALLDERMKQLKAKGRLTP